MNYLKFALIGVLVLSGCSFSRVQFDEQKAPQHPRFRTISAHQYMCEVERNLALFTDENNNLWLNCPYWIRGKAESAASYIGPKPHKGSTDYSFGDVDKKLNSMHREQLKSCGRNRYCADLDHYGYLDFSIQVAETRANITYLDVSDGLKDLDTFYQGLGGTFTLDKQLVRLVNTERVVDLVYQIDTLTQIQGAQAQLDALGLTDRSQIREALSAKRTELQIAEFRQQENFDGYKSAFQLSRDQSDLESMQKLAETDEQKSAVFAEIVQDYRKSHRAGALQTAGMFAVQSNERKELDELLKAAEEERQAELRRQEEAKRAEARRQEEARLAEVRRQEEAKLAEQRARQAREEEERCMRNPTCRAEVEKRRAECVRKIQQCREGCDRAVGSGSYGSFFANLAAAGMARACYAGCKCDAGFGDLVTKFNNATAGTASTSRATAAQPQAAKAKVYECKIFCKSSSGPTIFKRIEAATRKDAAKIAGDHANEYCLQEHQSYASGLTLPESQCQER
jgi:hypothetical protein